MKRLFFQAALASTVAVLVAGGVEAATTAGGALAAAAQIGLFAVIAFPLGILVAAGGTWIWRSWRSLPVVDENGAVPRLAAGILYAGLGAAHLSLSVFHTVAFAAKRKLPPTLVALTGSLAALAALGLVVVLSRPVLSQLTAWFRRIDAAAAARRGRPLFRPRLVVGGTALALAIVLAVEWKVALAPRMGLFDPWFIGIPAIYLAALAATLAALGRFERPRVTRPLAAVLLGALALAGGTAAYVRAARIPVLLDIWADAPFAGRAAELVFDPMTAGARAAALPPPVERAGAAHPDVILITVDTTRADQTPPYGGEADMPAFAAFARGGAVFEWAFASGAVTRRSVPSLLTGFWPTRVRGRRDDWTLRIDPRHTLLAERFRAAGYQTAAFLCCLRYFGSSTGMVRGFQQVEYDPDSRKLGRIAKRWIARQKPPAHRKPYFIWIHYYDPHDYEKTYPAEEYGRAPEGRYRRTLADVDAALKIVLDEALSPARRARTVVALTSDHGESLNQHKTRWHGFTLYNTEIRVPLVVVGPGVPAARIAPPVGLVDLVPTLLDLAGYEPPEDLDGRSLRPFLEAPATPIDEGEASSFLLKDRLSPHTADATIVGRYKLIHQRGRVELYDLAADPDEARDLAAELPAVVARLEAVRAQRRRIEGQAPF